MSLERTQRGQQLKQAIESNSPDALAAAVESIVQDARLRRLREERITVLSLPMRS